MTRSSTRPRPTTTAATAPTPTPANNTATDTDTLIAAPDLVITKTDGLTSVQPGQTLTYTLTISNVGTQDATGVIVTDILPEHTTFISASGSSASLGGVVTWNVGTLAAGARSRARLRCVVNSTVPAGVTEITNEASVRDDGTNGPDPTPAEQHGHRHRHARGRAGPAGHQDGRHDERAAGADAHLHPDHQQRGQPGGHRRHPHRHAAGQHHVRQRFRRRRLRRRAW